MEQFHRRTINYFYALALILLSTGLIFGFLGALEYILPGVSKRYISFEKIRPLHVSSMVFWILTAAVGAVLTFLQEHIGKGLRFPKLAKLQLMIFGLTFFGILVSYLFGIFGGRE
ncbi:MAG: cbb3-type cytochrome c oxidase subunit I, partial [Weeksellaceae bacterium]|nr:cbb3-type cytochrome c oxidase subunit I [Weeksellaceae bacterium]